MKNKEIDRIQQMLDKEGYMTERNIVMPVFLEIQLGKPCTRL